MNICKILEIMPLFLQFPKISESQVVKFYNFDNSHTQAKCEE